jgi:putative copper export protein
MKARFASLLAVLLVAGALQAMAASLITKVQAEKDALAAVGGGTVTQAVLDSNLGKKTWSVDITGATNEYEVWVDAHTGAILKIITQPLARRSPTGQVGQTSSPN